jgi:hypothetical protein
MRGEGREGSCQTFALCVARGSALSLVVRRGRGDHWELDLDGCSTAQRAGLHEPFEATPHTRATG